MKRTTCLLATVLVVALLCSLTSAFAQQGPQQPIGFYGTVTFQNGSPAPDDATKVWAIKGTCQTSQVQVCGVPCNKPAGSYYIPYGNIDPCGDGTYTVKAEYIDLVNTIIYHGSATHSFTHQSGGGQVDIVLTELLYYRPGK